MWSLLNLFVFTSQYGLTCETNFIFKWTLYKVRCGSGSSVIVVTDYGQDVTGSNLGGDEIFPPVQTGPGATQPPVQWVPGLSRR